MHFGFFNCKMLLLSLKYKLNWRLSRNQFFIRVITRVQLLIHHRLAFLCYRHPQANNIHLWKQMLKSHHCLCWINATSSNLTHLPDKDYWFSDGMIDGIKHLVGLTALGWKLWVEFILKTLKFLQLTKNSMHFISQEAKIEIHQSCILKFWLQIYLNPVQMPNFSWAEPNTFN